MSSDEIASTMPVELRLMSRLRWSEPRIPVTTISLPAPAVEGEVDVSLPPDVVVGMLEGPAVGFVPWSLGAPASRAEALLSTAPLS